MTDSLPYGFTRAQWRLSLAAAMASISIAVFSFGFTAPLLNLLLERDGVRSDLIGLNAVTGMVAVIVVTPFVARIASIFGTLPTLIGGLVLMVGSLLLLAVFRDIWAWMALRFLMGIGGAAHWVISEIWVNTLATGAKRGRIMGVYVTVLAGSYGAGPLVLSVVGVDGWTPFIIGSSALALAAVPLLAATRLAPSFPRHSAMRLGAAFLRAPVTMAAAIFDGLLNGVLFNMLPLYAVRSGFTEELAARLVAVKVLGSFLTQYFIGLLAERYNARALLMLTAAIAALGALLLPISIQQPIFIWPMVFVWGGLMSGIYTIALTQLGRRFSPDEMAGANAMFVLMHVMGEVAGPVSAGVAMEVWDPHGLLVVVVFASVVFIAGTMLRSLLQAK